MATVYSLVCWGGATGKTITANATTDRMTLTNHGLHNGTGVQITSGTPPTGLALNTTYYSKSYSGNEFELYSDAALTTRMLWSDAGASLVMQSTYFLLSVPDYTRYGGAGVSDPTGARIYDGLLSWKTAYFSSIDKNDEIVCELGQAFSDVFTNALQTFATGAAKTLITSTVNGVRSSAFHGGVIGAGYIAQISYIYGGNDFNINGINQVVDGFSIFFYSTSYNLLTYVGLGTACAAINMMIGNPSAATGSPANDHVSIAVYGTLARVENSLIFGTRIGIHLTGSYCMLKNNTVVNCILPFNTLNDGSSNGFWATAVNNVSNGGWFSTLMTELSLATNNAGSTGTAWAIGTGTRIDITDVATVFVDYANKDYRLKAGSPLIDAGILSYGAIFSDIADAERPNYNNGGSEAFDIGCYEYDHGYGPHPASTTVTFAGVNANSEIRVYLPDGSEVAGVEDCVANQALSWPVYAPGSANNTVHITILLRGFRWQKFPFVSSIGNQTLPIFQIADLGYYNPA